MQKKLHKWGYLNYVLSVTSGFSYDFDLFTGKHRTDLPENCPAATGNMVTRLIDTVPKHSNHKLFIDNWYTSLPLMAFLYKNGVLPLETVQLNRAKTYIFLAPKSFSNVEEAFVWKNVP